MLKRYVLPVPVVLAMALAVAAQVAGPGASAARAQAADAPARPAAAPGATARTAEKKVKAPKPAKPPKPPEPSYAELRAKYGAWAHGSNWLSFRAGYATASGGNLGDGLGGYGIAYRHMMTSRWSVDGTIDHEILGHLAHAYEISVPFTLGFTRHITWQTALHPYLGFGGGYYFHKFYRTGPDYTGAPEPGWFVNGGLNLPLSDRHVFGVDGRVSFVSGRDGVVNPVFGPELASETLWTVKLTWALDY